jgi:hypothetical protein
MLSRGLVYTLNTRTLPLIGVMTGAAGVVYGMFGVNPAPVLPTIGFLIGCLGAAVYLPRDATLHRISLVTDWGWFVAIGWPFLWLWYARRTGRSWGIALATTAVPVALEIGQLIGFVLRAILTIV